MHDHNPRGAHFVVRTSPPQVQDFMQNTMHHSKHQQQHPHYQHHQHHHQQQQQRYLQHQQHHIQQQQHYSHHQNQHCQQEKEVYQKLPHDNPTIFHPQFPSTAHSSVFSSAVYSEEDFEDIDEDQISDLDEEEELRLSYEQYRQNFQRQPDVTSQLLQFADMVSADIRKFFGRSKEQEDACDVYEDKWATTKSGRELYYADLLRIAQGDTEPISKSSKKLLSALSTSSSSSLSPHNDSDNRSQFSGKRNVSLGMGPLTELFEYGLHNFIQSDKKQRSVHSKAKVSTLSPVVPHGTKQSSHVVPMHDRNFPESFWREPQSHGNSGHFTDSSNRMEISQQNMLATSKLPDFSDLVESWQGMSTVSSDRGGRMDIPMDHQRL